MQDKFGQILDVFSAQEIDLLTKILSKIPMQNYGRPDTFNNGFVEQDTIFPFIRKHAIDRINTVCSKKIKRVSVGMQLVTKNPYGIHTDFHNKGDSGHGTAYLIPLWSKPVVDKKSSTIIFEQAFTASNNLSDYVVTDPLVPKKNAEWIWDQLPNTADARYAKYLSVGLIAEWHIGSVIYWDRSLFHSSDEFRKKGIEQKSALVLFASDDQ